MCGGIVFHFFNFDYRKICVSEGCNIELRLGKSGEVFYELIFVFFCKESTQNYIFVCPFDFRRDTTD